MIHQLKIITAIIFLNGQQIILTILKDYNFEIMYLVLNPINILRLVKIIKVQIIV